jgi:hypothetical protein
VIRTSVSPLQLESPFDGLKIDEDRLRLDADPPPLAGGHRVPRSKVAGDRKRYLGSPANARVELSAQPFEEPLLTGIPERVTAGVRSNPELQPDRRSQTPEQFGIDPPRMAAFDPTLGRGADPARLAELTPAQTAQPSTDGDLGENATFVLGDHAPRAVRPALPGRHRPEVSRLAMHPRLLDGCAWYARSIGWTAAGRGVPGSPARIHGRAVHVTHSLATRRPVLRWSVRATHVAAETRGAVRATLVGAGSRGPSGGPSGDASRDGDQR